MARNERYPAYLAKVLSNPILNRVPRNDREMAQFTKELATAVLSQVPIGQAGNVGSVQNKNPLTASDTSPGATISIAAHTLYTINGNVEYNAGTITGLAKDTQYFVYAVDPNLEGGAVTYQASTTPASLTNTQRYYVGTITTPAEGASPSTTTGTIGGGTGGSGSFDPGSGEWTIEP